MPTLIISLCTSQIFILCIFVASASSIVVHVVHGVLDDARLTSHVPKIKESIRCDTQTSKARPWNIKLASLPECKIQQGQAQITLQTTTNLPPSKEIKEAFLKT